MKVDLLDRNAVDVALGLGDALVHRHGVIAGRLRQIQAGEDVGYVVEPCVRVVVMLMVGVVGFFRTVDQNGHVGAPDAAFDGAPGLIDHAGEAQTIESGQKAVPVRHQFQQGCGEHIARSAHAAVNVKGFHLSASLAPYGRVSCRHLL